MNCIYYQTQQCQSCRWLNKPYALQVATKQQQLTQLLAAFSPKQMLPMQSAEPFAFRNKAKMVALGAAHQPKLGIINERGEAVSLTQCPLYSAKMNALLHDLEGFIQRAGIAPYNVQKQKGELKFVIVTESEQPEGFMLRFVLRSEQAIERIKRNLALLQQQWPSIKVVSVNIQPVHMAVLEGEQELFLTEQTLLNTQLNAVPLFIRAQSFFQTHPELAAKLYHTAASWVAALVAEHHVQHCWDLFCGVGGFGLHMLAQSPGLKVTGIEIEAEAINCAKQSALAMQLANQIDFAALDATQFALAKTNPPDCVLVNPPRRGIGAELCEKLQQLKPRFLLYSSCNPSSLASDLAQLPHYQLVKVQGFDFFPHTSHFEVLTMLQLIE